MSQGTLQNDEKPKRPRLPPEERALQNLLDVAGETWNPEMDIDTNLISDSHVTTYTCPTREGNFPDPSSCDHYYTCDHGVAHRNSCGKGLVWNTVIQQCDWSTNVDCHFDQSFLTTY